MMELTLRIVKQSLNIDYTDNDDYLELLLDASIERAENITGIDRLDFNFELQMAIISDIGFAFENRGNEAEVQNNSIKVFRKYSKRAML